MYNEIIELLKQRQEKAKNRFLELNGFNDPNSLYERALAVGRQQECWELINEITKMSGGKQ